MLPEKIEYRVRPVTRYVVTRYAESKRGGDCSAKGEFDNEQAAYDVAYAVCKLEHQQLGWPLDDERIQYPKPLNTGSTYVQPAALLQVRAQMPTSSATSHADNEAAVRELVGPDEREGA